MHYYTNGSDVIVSANGAGDYYTQDVTIGPDGLARIAYQNAHGHGADFIRCTDASCGARSTSEITYSGQYAYDVSIAVGADGKALIGGGSSTGVSAYLDYIRCRTADCSSYSDQVLPGSCARTRFLSQSRMPQTIMMPSTMRNWTNVLSVWRGTSR